MNDRIVEARWVVELEKQQSDQPFPEHCFPLPVDDCFAADKIVRQVRERGGRAHVEWAIRIKREKPMGHYATDHTDRWRDRAEEMLSIAQTMPDTETKAQMARLAGDWRRMAERIDGGGSKRDVKLGGDCGNLREVSAKARQAALEARRKAIRQRASNLGPIIAELRAKGITSLRGTANELNARGVPAARGGKWTATQVKRLPR
jgi:hypothetical protein